MKVAIGAFLGWALVKTRGFWKLYAMGLLGAAVAAILKLRVPPKPKKIENQAPENREVTLSKYPSGMRFKTTDGTEALPIRRGLEDFSSMAPTTLHALFLLIIKKGKGGFPALRVVRVCIEAMRGVWVGGVCVF